jgi:NAD(P)-dependent dehydrogenase (short-subunit alcohol dehydrogenase family)
VVVNDVGCALDGRGADVRVAASVVDDIRACGGDAVASVEPVGTAAAATALVGAALSAFGRLDVLVTSAGITRSHALVDFPDDDWERVLAVHLTGTFTCARAAFAAMQAGGLGGRIITTTSGAGLDHVYPGTAAYAAAKGGIASLTRVIALEGAAHAITCNAIAPLARTRMSEAFLADEDDSAAWLDPVALGPLVVYLASPVSAGVNGEVVTFRRGRIGVLRVAGGPDIAPAGTAWTVEEIAARLPALLA